MKEPSNKKHEPADLTANPGTEAEFAAEELERLYGAQVEAAVEAAYDPEEPRSNFIAVLGIAGSLVLFGLIVGLQYYFDNVRAEEVYVQVLSKESEQLRELRAREEGQLNSYQLLNAEQGTVQLPIDRAIELLVEEAKAKPAAPPLANATAGKTAPGAAPGGKGGSSATGS